MRTSSEKFDFNDLFIFEMANNHQGSLAHGKKIIQEVGKIVKESGVRGAIKFQFRDLKTFIHPKFLKSKDNKHIQRFISTELTKNDFALLVEEARKNNLIVISTPFDEKSVDLAVALGIDIIKVASCSANDWPLLEKIQLTRKPVIASTAGLEIEDVDKLVSFFEHRFINFALMHCVAIYPTPIDKLELQQISLMKRRYPNVTIGFSTHESPDNFEAIQIAYSLGARIYEKHVGVETKDIKLNSYSANPEQLRKWVEAKKRATLSNMVSVVIPEEEIKDLSLLKRGVFARRNVKKGEFLKEKDVFYAFPIQVGQLASGQFKTEMVADKDYKKLDALSSKCQPKEQNNLGIIYSTISRVKGMLNEAGVNVGIDNNIEISHHYGLEKFNEVGIVIIDCINREYCKKVIVQLPGQFHPHHYHKKKEEAFQILSGEMILELNGRQRLLTPGDTVIVRRGILHSFWTDKGVIFEEVSTTHFNNDSFYEDPDINKLERSERKTELFNWGLHQFS